MEKKTYREKIKSDPDIVSKTRATAFCRKHEKLQNIFQKTQQVFVEEFGP